MNLTIHQLRCFLAVYETKSFSEAAYKLFMTQSAVSKTIKVLENELGCTLFQRNTTTSFLTPEGEIFLEYAINVFKDFDMLIEKLNKSKNSNLSVLRFGNIPLIPMYTNFNIGRGFAHFTQEYPEFSSTLHSYEASQPELLKDIITGKADVAIVRAEHIPNIKDYDVLEITTDEIVLICSKNHPLSKYKAVNLQDVVRYPFYQFGDAAEINDIIYQAFEAEGLHMEFTGDCTRPRIIFGMVQEGDYISLLPRNVIDTTNFNRLTILPLTKPIYSRVVMVRSKFNKPSRLADAYWNRVRHLLPVPKEGYMS